MNIEYIVKLDGRILPHVTACTSGINDLVSDKSGRITASGKMVRYMIDRIPSSKAGVCSYAAGGDAAAAGIPCKAVI
ncbi:MAG: hypothetical protein ACLRS2_19740 [[Clostridium] innocuum]